MNIYARQGDLVIAKLTSASSGELYEETNAVLAGSAGSEHVLMGTQKVRREDGRILLRIDEPTKIVHGDRHLPTHMEAGDYEVTRKRERGDGSDREVED